MTPPMTFGVKLKAFAEIVRGRRYVRYRYAATTGSYLQRYLMLGPRDSLLGRCFNWNGGWLTWRYRRRRMKVSERRKDERGA